jgi:hypothetical protein
VIDPPRVFCLLELAPRGDLFGALRASVAVAGREAEGTAASSVRVPPPVFSASNSVKPLPLPLLVARDYAQGAILTWEDPLFRILGNVASALAYMESRGVLHR